MQERRSRIEEKGRKTKMQKQEKSSILVLLSTYNGETYLEEQINSILMQKGCQVKLLIRDDGSTDATKEILREYQQGPYQDYFFPVLEGRNIGAARSFFELFREAASFQYEYYALADQDDIWFPDKLYRAVSLIRQEETKKRGQPVVYCSAKQLVDAKLQPLKAAVQYPNITTSFGNALVENMCTGCTCVVNRELMQILKKGIPEFTIMHDFWIYLVGTCFGRVIYDKEARILYRQHERNKIGAASSLLKNYERRIRNFHQHRGQLSRQAKEFLRLYSADMPQKEKRLIKEFLSAKKNYKIRKKLLSSREIFRQRKSDDLIFRVLLTLKCI